MLLINRLMVIGGISLSVAGFYVAARWCYADWLSLQSTLSEREHAARLAPTDASIWIRLANLASVNGQDTRPLLAQALMGSPEDVGIWIRLGLESEAFSDYVEAEHCLSRAVRLSREVAPAWTLAQFYLRRGNEDGFFAAAQRAAGFSRGDLEPVFRLAWAISPESHRMLQKGMPDAPGPLIAYLNWLLSSDRLDAADGVAHRILERFPMQGKEALLSYCDRLIATYRLQPAADLWNALWERRLVKTGPVRGSSILNGSFQHTPLNSGFDWRLYSTDALEVTPAYPGLWIRLTGDQKERSEIASQMLLVDRAVHHRLRYQFTASGVEAGLGVRWAIMDPRRRATLSQSTDLSDAASGSGVWDFNLPRDDADAGPRLLRLLLLHMREPAAPRANGLIRIDSISLEVAS